MSYFICLKLTRTDNYYTMAAFRNLMKSKGLLGGKYSVGLDEEVVNDILDKMDNDETFEQSENKKRKIEEKDEKNEKDEIGSEQ